MSTGPLGIEFVTRQGCTICVEAEEVVRSVAARFDMPVIVRDVDEEPGLSDLSDRVPVVLSASGQVLAEGQISAGALWLRLAMRRLGGI